MNAPISADDLCEHSWSYNKPANASASVRICSLCHKIDGEELMRTLDEYATAFKQKPTTIVYAWSDGRTLSVIDQPGGIPDSARERALLRGLLGYALSQLDQYEITGPLGIATHD
ncbi:hypothetical protein OIE75_29785 [Streptomyces sp. NBC_01723]|uniref:hypothetical protein n=1 Tax=Streptomyces sp. NBC_01723 TaxID=2975921 RepID=UPI002E307D80|nr:hypothetical protein [Streptomyces sp. NBC_01723]